MFEKVFENQNQFDVLRDSTDVSNLTFGCPPLHSFTQVY